MIKEFLSKNGNWYYIILAVLAVAGFVVSLVLALKRNKGSNIFDSIKEALLENIPFWSVLSEGLASGQAKKDNVLTLGIALVDKMLGRKMTADEISYFTSFISENLEKVLAAPQKKLKTAESAKNGKYRIN